MYNKWELIQKIMLYVGIDIRNQKKCIAIHILHNFVLWILDHRCFELI